MRIPNWLGDTMLARRAISTICQAHPGREVILAGRAHLLALLRNEFPEAQLVATQPGLAAARQLGSRLKGMGTQSYWMLPTSLSSRLGGLWSGATHRIGFGPRPARPHERESGLFLTERVARGAIGSQHMEDEYLALTGTARDGWSARRSLPIGDRVGASLENLLPPRMDGGYVVIAPGARYGPAKRWPAPSFSQTIQLLMRAHPDLKILMVGDERDRTAAETILTTLPGNVHSLVGKTDLNQLAGVLARARAVLSNDSGTAHLSAALGRPTVVIFGSTDPAWTSPRGPQVIIHNERLRCSPCFKRKCPWKDAYACLRVIEPRQVAESFESLLGQVAA